MNAGIADATNLAWLLAAALQGWADPAILDAYEAERLPITDQVSRFAMDMAGKVLGQRRTVPEEIELEGPEGDAVRQRVGQAAYDLNVQQYCCGGLNFGYFYDASPIIVYDGASQPAYTMADFTPSTAPGCRLPFCELPDGRPVYDALGPGYTLLRTDPGLDGGGAGRRHARPRHPHRGCRRARRRRCLRSQADPGADRPACGLARRCLPDHPEHLIDTLRGKGAARQTGPPPDAAARSRMECTRKDGLNKWPGHIPCAPITKNKPGEAMPRTTTVSLCATALLILVQALSGARRASPGRRYRAVQRQGSHRRIADFSVREAMAIEHGRVLATGTSQDMQKLAGANARLVDLGGRTVIPGLTDGHIHGVRAAATFGTEVNWIGVPTLKEALEKIHQAAQTQKPGSWIIVAGGWTEEQFAEKRRPTPAEIIAGRAGQSGLHPASL